MNAEEIDEKLAVVPPGFVPPPAPPEPPPLESLIAGALEFAQQLPPDPEGPSPERARRAAQIRARLPAIFADRAPRELLARVHDPRLVAAARAATWTGVGFILVGPTGLGKSTAAAWIFRRLLGEGLHQGGDLWFKAEQLRWFEASDIMRARAEHKLGQGDAPIMTRAMSASVLFIDDAGWDREDPSAVSHVLAKRYNRGKPTILTSGLSADALTDHYGDAPVRRMVESGGGRSVLVDCFEEPPNA